MNMKYKRIGFLVVFYALCKQDGTDLIRLSYDAPTQQIADDFFQKKQVGRPDFTYSFVDKATYDTFAKPADTVGSLLADKVASDQAKIDLNTKAKTDAERIDALVRYLRLDK